MNSFAFVFPGQGSQSVGMLDAWGDHPAVLRDLGGSLCRAGRGHWPADQGRPQGSAGLTTNTQPVMLVAGVAAYRAWRAEGGAAPAAVAGHSLGEYTALVAAGVLTLAAGCAAGALSRPGHAGGRAGGRGRDGGHPGPGRCQGDRRLRRRHGSFGRKRRGGRGGQLQRSRADRDRRQQGRRRKGLRSAQGQGRQARVAAAGVGAVPFQPDEAGGREAARAAGSQWRLRAPQIPVVNNIDVAVETDADRIRDALVPPGLRPGALGRVRAGASRRAA